MFYFLFFQFVNYLPSIRRLCKGCKVNKAAIMALIQLLYVCKCVFVFVCVFKCVFCCIFLCVSVHYFLACACLSSVCSHLFVFIVEWLCVCKCASTCSCVWGLRGHAGVEGFLSQDGHNGWRERLPRWQTEEGMTYTTTNNKRKTR